MRITQNKYYQVNINKNVNSKMNYASMLTFKMSVNEPLQSVDRLEKTVQKKSFLTKMKNSAIIAGSFLAGLFGISANKDSKNSIDTTEEINSENVTNNGKIQSEKIFEIEEFLDNSMLLEEFFKLNPNIDINSKNKNGDTIVLKAIRENNYHILHQLKKQEQAGIINGINWNAIDSEGKNGLMIAIERNHSRDIEYLNGNDYERVYNYKKSYEKKSNDKNTVYDINDLLELGVNPNYINKKTKFQNFYCTPLQELIIVSNKAAVDAMLESPKTDVNLSHPDTPPPIFMMDDTFYGDYALFERMIKHPSCDLHKEYKGQCICEYLSEPDRSFMAHRDMIDMVQEILTKKSCDNLKQYYQTNGELTLDQIYEYIQLPQLNDVIDKPLNDLNQNIAHFAAGVHVDGYEELRKLNMIIKQILKHSYILHSEDALGRTAFDIACEAGNYNFLKVLLSGADRFILSFSGWELEKALKKLPQEQLDEILPFVREQYKKHNMTFM